MTEAHNPDLTLDPALPPSESLNRDDMQRCLATMPKKVRAALQKSGAFLCGGYIRARIAGEKVNDFDFLVQPGKAAALVDLLQKAYEAKKVHRTANATTITPPGMPALQVIHRWTFDTLAEALDSLDFTIATAGIQYGKNGWTSRCSPDFYPDLAAKRLRYRQPQRIEDEGGSLLRVLKFVGKGYHISPMEMAKVVARACKGLDGDASENERCLHLGKVLFEVDPLVMVGHIVVDEHETFPVAEK
ncbi:MAG: hypothetical protein JKY94_16845 [Rhodobacteraceae bacterium]|nr:hypothetical protein [Paracoccaceae bacterium]